MGECFQIEKLSWHLVKPNQIILVRRHLNGSTTAWYQGQQLTLTKLAKRPESLSQQKASILPLSASAAGKRSKRVSPWGKI